MTFCVGWCQSFVSLVPWFLPVLGLVAVVMLYRRFWGE